MKRFSIWNVCARLAVMFVLIGLLPACIIVVEEDDDDDYYRRRWQLEIIVYEHVQYRPDNSGLYTVSFHQDDVISGHTECAGFDGRYEVGRANALSVDGMSIDDDNCADAPLSTLFLDGIKNARSFEGNTEELTIHFEGTNNIMRLVPD